MIKSILLVVDGQPAEHASVDVALQWASEFDARLVGLGVIDDRVIHPLEAVPLGASQAKLELDAARLHEAREANERRLAAIAVRCAGRQVAFQSLTRFGEPAEEIAVEAQSCDVILVPRPAESAEDAVEQSMAKALRAVLRAAPRPIVTVPKQGPAGDSVVIAYDGSLQAARTLQLFESSGLARKRSIHVVCVDEDPLEAARLGNRAVDFLAHHGLRSTLAAETRAADPSEHITKLAQRLDAGLLVMGAYGQSRLHELVVGSVTQTVLAKCSIPLFLYH